VRRAWLVGVVVVAAAAGIAAWLARGDAERPSPDAPRSAAVEAPAPELAASETDRAPRAAAVPEPIAAAPPSAGAPTSGPARVVVRAVGPNDEPIAGAAVRLSIVRGEARSPPTPPCATDAEGRCEPDLSAWRALPSVRRAAADLGISVSAPGRPTGRLHVDAATLLRGGLVERRVVLEPGAVLRGRVVASASPVADARVKLELPSVTSMTSTDGEGRFEFWLIEPGAHRLVAEAPGKGAAGKTVDLDETRDTDAGDLDLVGPGVIEGVARFPDSKPVAGLAVLAWDASRPMPSQGFWTEAEPKFPPGGLVVTVDRTDDHGRFRLAGLRPGRYAVSYGLETDETHETGATGVVLVVPNSRLRFRVVDEAGDPVPGARYTARSFEDGGGFSFEGTVTEADGFQDVWGNPGTPFGFAARAGEGPASEVRAVVPVGSYEATVPVVLRERGPPTGRLGIRLRQSDGAPVRRAFVALRTEIAGATVMRGAYESETGEYSIPDLPEGNLLLEMLPGEIEEPDVPRDFHHSIHQRVTIRGGAESTLDLRARLGGRVRVTFRTAAGGDLPGDLQTFATPRDGGDPVRIDFLAMHPDRGGWTARLYAGARAVGRQALEPGRYVLRASGAGVRDAVAAVDVVAGQFTDAEMTLQAK